MRRDPETLREEDRKDEKRVLGVNRAVEDIKTRKLTEIEQRCKPILAKIEALTQEKGELLRAPQAKSEIIQWAKDRLREEKKNHLQMFLKEHLQACLTRKAIPFDPITLRTWTLPEGKCYQLVFFCITPEDINEAAAGLEDVGIPEEEREAKIKKIDATISRLEKQISNGS